MYLVCFRNQQATWQLPPHFIEKGTPLRVAITNTVQMTPGEVCFLDQEGDQHYIYASMFNMVVKNPVQF